MSTAMSTASTAPRTITTLSFNFNFGTETKVDSDQGQDARLKGPVVNNNNVKEGSGNDANIESSPEGKPVRKPKSRPEAAGDISPAPETPPNVPTIPLGRPGFRRSGAPFEAVPEAQQGMKLYGHDTTDVEDDADNVLLYEAANDSSS